MSATSTVSPAVAVVGGGVSGLATCYFLAQQGIRPLLIEKSGRLGGLIRTDHWDGCDLEAGPDSFIAAKTSVAALAQELGITGRIIGSNDAARRIFIRRRGRLIPMPKGMVMIAPGDLSAALRSPLFSVSTKIRFLTEQFAPARERPADISIAEFVGEHFGNDILHSLAEPLLSGVYGGDPGRLSASAVLPRFVEYERKYGSLVKALRAERKPEAQSGSLFLSFDRGMQTLTDALAQAIQPTADVRFAAVLALERSADGWRVHLNGDALAVKNVVLACPAHVNAGLLRDSAPDLASHLGAIPYSSAILATLVYQRETLGHELNGFGVLVPRMERRDVAAVTWVSTKFPSRIPGHFAALRAFIVGRRADELLAETDDALAGLVRAEFQTLMGITAEPAFSSVNRWPDSMPQYVVGHQRRRETITSLLTDLPGLFLCGNAYDGVGVPDCVRLARQVATAIGTVPSR